MSVRKNWNLVGGNGMKIISDLQGPFMQGPYRLDAIRHCDANFQFSMTFNLTIFLCLSNIWNHLSNFSYLACIYCKIFFR